ncbi:VanZ family protein [Actinomycetospora sp. CA-101289]|uniref:VanZ family protein n=1 Tax=Actinomycetospora sp. CA-101289 TaxID=3239893 RepID=UPI003D992C7F
MEITSWYFWLATFTGQALLLVVALPFSALVVWALAVRRRSRGASAAWAWRSSLADVGMVHGTLPWVWMTMLPGSHAGAVPGRLSLVPLEDLPTMGWPGIAGNLLVFVALGFFAPVRWAALASVPRVLALAASCSVLIEVAQYVLRLDRVSSVDDVLLNTAGAGLAALAFHRWWRTAATDGAATSERRPLAA